MGVQDRDDPEAEGALVRHRERRASTRGRRSIRQRNRTHGRAFFPGFPETTAPELIYSSILGSRSDKPVQFDRITRLF